MKNRRSAEISVFLALTVSLVFALLLAVLESARTEGARLYLTIAANSSVDSLFSQYHRQLWEQYRLLGLEHYSEQQLKDETNAFLRPYLEADNWYPMTPGDTRVQGMSLLTGENGAAFEEEVMDYMKFGIAADIWDLAEAKLFTDGVREGPGTAALSSCYQEHASEAAGLEKDLKKLSDCLSDQEKAIREAEEYLEDCDGEGFMEAAGFAVRELEKIPDLVSRYEEHADALSAGLDASAQRMEEALQNGEISPELADRMQEEIREYDSYVQEDGARRKEIRGYPLRAEINIRELEEMIEEAEEICEMIDDWEPEEEEDAEDGPDEEALWAPLLSRIRRYDLITMSCRHGLKDPEKEQKLEDLGKLLEERLWSLVLPEGCSVSSEKLQIGNSPSKLSYMGSNTSGLDLKDRLYMAEYMSRMMRCFGKETENPGPPLSGGHLEAEYVLWGKDNDAENLGQSIKRLTELRTGLNLVYLYGDHEKKTQARMLAMEITGALGLTPMAAVMTFFIMSIWALAQAVCDVRDLLEGYRVPFMHTRDSFYINAEKLPEMAAGDFRTCRPQNGEGLGYADYLKIFLFSGLDSEMEFRCMDVMQMNLQREQPDFRMDRLIRSLELSVEAYGSHLFTAAGHTGSPGGRYNMSVRTAYSY